MDRRAQRATTRCPDDVRTVNRASDLAAAEHGFESPNRNSIGRQTRPRRGRQPSYVHGHFGISCASSRHLGAAGKRPMITGSDYRCTFGVPARASRGNQPTDRGRNGVTSRRHAAALRDGHVSHDAVRLASARARRAAAVRDVRSAGTASPVPEYISSGVCPRNAECGSTALYSWT
jgi:hypothetical protein